MIKKILKVLGITIGTTGITAAIATAIAINLPMANLEKNGNSTLAFSGCQRILIKEERKVGSDLWRPISTSGHDDIYCVEPGSPVRISEYTPEDIQQYEGRRTGKSCPACAGSPPGYGLYSTTYYECQNEHYTESSTRLYGKRVDNLYDVAYITSFYPQPGQDSISGSESYETWADSKQQAIWMSPLSQKGDPGRGSARAEGENLRNQSLEYQDFYEKIMEGEKGMKPQNLTNSNEVKWNTNQETQLHTIGPFKLNYVNGKYSQGKAFGGISDMYLIDNNGNRIDIVNFVMPNRQPQTTNQNYPVNYDLSSPRFFSNYDEGYQIYNPNCVDYWDWTRYYPNPGEEFYVEIDYLGEDVGSLKLHVDFQYLECTTEICIREGKSKRVSEYSHTHTTHMKTVMGFPVPCTDCRRTSKVVIDHMQNGVYIVRADRRLIQESLEIEIFGNPYMSARMKVGGFVFEDIPQTKEDIANGRKDENDINLKNIEVALYDAETGKLAHLTTLQEENPNASSGEINDLDDYGRRINPTLTDENGYYEFRGVSREKKYYVQFTYNGQTYTATEYLSDTKADDVKEMVDKGDYDGATRNRDWQETSKGTELTDERDAYDESFAEIGSSPNNYISDNSLRSGALERVDGDYYNETFSIYTLSGISLNPQGEYEYNPREQLIDSYYKVENGYVINTAETNHPELTEGIISEKIRDYIKRNRKYPTNLKTQIYEDIARNNDETWKKLQFIEDCKIQSYTKNQDADREKEYDLYPVYNQFTTFVASGNLYPNNSYERGTYNDKASTYADTVMKATGNRNMLQYRIWHNVIGNPHYIYHNYMQSDINVVYKNVYAGQLMINQGLWRRQEYDVSLKKDVFKATLKINGKTEIYEYNEREIITDEERAELKRLEKEYGRDSVEYLNYQLELENKFWDIQARIIGPNYASYYGETYSREIYPSERNYTGTNQLEAYITYKITIRNQSQSILAQIQEVVDYYDSDYTFEPNLSWAMYRGDHVSNRDVQVTDQEYYDIMHEGSKDTTGQEKYRDVTLGNRYNTTTGMYAENTQFSLGSEYKTLYVNGLSDHKLETGETAYLYLTFKINGVGSNLVIENDNTGPGKQNIAEINGYMTYYADGTELPNGIRKNSNDVAGLIDQDSNPGNFDRDALNNTAGTTRYEQNFEDDADRARGINVYVDASLVRQLDGTVWEDKRNYQAPTMNGNSTTDALVGNGVREDNEVTISGVRVELHEVIDGVTQENIAKVWNKDTNTWIDAATVTDEKGYYYFEGYIPGDYVVRFIYGGDESYTYNGQTYDCNAYYNGQDYKSTSYQYNHINNTAIDQNGRTDVSGKDHFGYNGYTDYEKQNDTATFGYNIFKSDEFVDEKGNKINVSDAKDIYSSEQISQNRENVNNYSSNNYSGVTYDKANTLNQNTTPNSSTQMVAETGAIRMEFEYNRQAATGNNTYNNDGYRPEGDRNVIDYKDNTNQNYYLQDVDFGLEERPKAGLELNKQVHNVRITLANQTVLFDANQTVNNLTWQPKTPYNINEMKTNTDIDKQEGNRNGGQNVYSDYAGYKDIDTNKDQENRVQDYNEFRNKVLDRIHTLVTKEKGLIQPTMDQELMHGATIQITYDVTVTNMGEVDYNETQFYYIGKVNNPETIVRTSADVVMDYVANNLQFRTQSNQDAWDWSTITEQEIQNNNYVNTEVQGVLKDYNTIITTEALNEKLIPLTESTKDSAETQDEVQLILTQLITSQNEDDDLTYDNIGEIVKISNDVGRRMAYSVQGNQNPKDAPTEPDSSMAERVVILPPFGATYLYIGLAVLIAAMLGISIVVIKKTVLNKGRF